VDGCPDPTYPSESESYYLVNAMDPGGDGKYGIRPEVVSLDGLSGVHLDDYDVVLLAAVPEIPTLVEPLKEYVRGGGGLAIFMGDTINYTFYNGPFYENGEGLLPFRIGPQVGDAVRREKKNSFAFDPKSIAGDRMVRVFRGDLAAATGLVNFFRYVPVEERSATTAPPDVKPPRVLARFTDAAGSPAIVSRQFGRGNLVVFYSSASMKWNDWANDGLGTYVVVLHEMIAEIARVKDDRFTAGVGEAIVYEPARAFQDATATLKTPHFPADDLVSLLPRTEGGRKRLTYERPLEAGVYSLTLQVGALASEVFFVRNPDPAEGNLAPGGQAELASALGSDGFEYRWRVGAATAAEVRDRKDKEYWTWMVAALLVMLALETFLGRRFGHYA
jgi:hypothetical protein